MLLPARMDSDMRGDGMQTVFTKRRWNSNIHFSVRGMAELRGVESTDALAEVKALLPNTWLKIQDLMNWPARSLLSASAAGLDTFDSCRRDPSKRPPYKDESRI